MRRELLKIWRPRVWRRCPLYLRQLKARFQRHVLCYYPLEYVRPTRRSPTKVCRAMPKGALVYRDGYDADEHTRAVMHMMAVSRGKKKKVGTCVM